MHEAAHALIACVLGFNVKRLSLARDRTALEGVALRPLNCAAVSMSRDRKSCNSADEGPIFLNDDGHERQRVQSGSTAAYR